jgi:ribosomal protein S18 acetylase RimI-like enzyme
MHLVVEYRTFRNYDPPYLVEVWNESFSSRGLARLRHASVLERHVFSKPYFDPAGLIIAEENGKRIGFVHAGFGPNARETTLAKNQGIVCVVAVRPSHQRHGIGTELLRRAEAYLKERGAQTLYAGLMKPLAPFYFGVFGGSDMPGVLTSEKNAGPFLEKHGYRPYETNLVFQRFLDKPITTADARFAGLRRRFDVRIVPRIALGTWWQECLLGLVEPVEFRLEEKGSAKVAGRVIAWEMESFSWTWNVPSVGLLNIQVRDDLRRQGLAKFLMSNILRYLQDQYFGVTEIQMADSDQPALNLCRGLGFEQVDVGRIYRKT